MRARAGHWIWAALLLLGAPIVLAGDGKEQLRAALKDPEPSRHWIYDDIHAGIALAKQTDKPLLTVFR